MTDDEKIGAHSRRLEVTEPMYIFGCGVGPGSGMLVHRACKLSSPSCTASRWRCVVARGGRCDRARVGAGVCACGVYAGAGEQCCLWMVVDQVGIEVRVILP